LHAIGQTRREWGDQAQMAMTEAELTKAINRVDKRLDWIEESLGRLVELQYVPIGRSETRPDESGVPADVAELARAGQTMDAIKRYRELTGVDFAHARQVIDGL
jgi:hypothetical protein